MSTAANSRIRFLYKACLRLHNSLPTDMRNMGNMYVRDEFRRHLNAEQQHKHEFVVQWTEYVMTLSQQLGRPRSRDGKIAELEVGRRLDENELEALSETQICQLYELYQETTGHKS